jgi:hypothetical protein
VSTTAPQVTVQSPALDLTIAIGERVTLVYSVISDGTTSVSAFYDSDGQAGTGDEVTFATGLPTGEDKFTQLLTSTLSAQTIYIGVTATNSLGTRTAYASGRVTLTSAPQVVFNSPAGPIRVGSGVSVPVQFNGGLTTFGWRTFYDTDGAFNGNEVTILEGANTSSSIVNTSFNTVGLQPGVYYLGATVTTPSGGTATRYAPGTVTVVSGAFVQVLSPTVGLLAAPGALIQIIVAANDPTTSGSTIRLFYDSDNTFGNGNEFTITTIPVTASGATWDTTDVVPGTYWVGAELLNGLTPPLFSYSAGPVQIGNLGTGGTPGGGGIPGGGNAFISLTTPLVATTLLQNRVYRINWVTTLGAGEATVRVFREPDSNNDGSPDGPLTRITIGNAGIDATQQFVDFNTTGVVGKFFIGATLTPVSGVPITVYALGTITVRPLIFWVGDLQTRRDAQGRVIPQSGPFQGAVFQGHNFQDNLGSAMTATDDHDNDGRNEILIAAQYGKPFFFSGTGRGAGEAYLIYGSGARFSGSIGVNAVGRTVPGVIFSGIVPNPFPGGATTPAAKAGNSVPYTVDGQTTGAYESEGLRSVLLLPDQDGDGIGELAFSFPWCNSYSLAFQLADGFLLDIVPGMGRLENNGHFLRGGVVIVSSRNSLLRIRTAVSRRLDRVIQLHQVGQVFTNMPVPGNWPGREDRCDNYNVSGANDTWIFPCEGFWQDTLTLISPPRLADPLPTGSWIIQPVNPGYNCNAAPWNTIFLSQIDPPPTPTDPLTANGLTEPSVFNNGRANCVAEPAPFGLMYLGGTGFYSTGTSCADRVMGTPLEPFGCRILGQETTQILTGTTANRFGHSISTSGDFILVGAPRRSASRAFIPTLPDLVRANSGEVYMMQLRRPGAPTFAFPYAVPVTPGLPNVGLDPNLPYPHNWIIQDVGFYVYDTGCAPISPSLNQNSAYDNVGAPFHIVGASPGDQIGEVTGVHDINGDGVSDVLIGGPGTNGGRGAVYVIYRRQPEIEGDYLLDKLQLDPTHIERLNGLMIVGEPGENLGTSVGGGGAFNDDFNDDGFADALIGSPRAFTAAGAASGQVFILFGGRNLLNPAGGSTIAQLRDAGDGMLLTGAHAGDMTGMTVANAGDVNGDTIPDILIAAPDASPRFDSNGDGIADTIGLDLNGDGVPDDLDGDGTPDDMTHAGLVYVVFGGAHLTGTIGLNLIGTPDLPGLVIVGRKGGDFMGGGYTQPSNPNVPDSGLLARGVASAGDLDRDGRADLLIGSILADPEGKENAGEVYLIYGLTP